MSITKRFRLLAGVLTLVGTLALGKLAVDWLPLLLALLLWGVLAPCGVMAAIGVLSQPWPKESD